MRRRLRGVALELQPINQLELTDRGEGLWTALGNDPQFACTTDGFPLKAGWYGLSIELDAADGDRLEPVLYFDYGHGMHEAWSLHLNFIRPEMKRHAGVVLFPLDVQRLRLDPANVSCRFRARHLTLKRLHFADAGWRMLKAVAKERRGTEAGVSGLLLETWGKLRGSRGRREFAIWLHGLYIQRGIKAPTYERWLRLYDPPLTSRRVYPEMLVSILMPTFNTPEVWLRRCLDSVLAQAYPHWELCVADDASTAPQVRTVLLEYAQRDPRVRVVWREHNGHISAASNSALAMASGDYVALLDHDDELHPQALSEVVDALQRNPQWQLVYSDEDKIDADGRRYDPYFKPDWNPDLLRGHNCISHLGIYSRALVNGVGGFREGLEGSQDWDLALRCSEQLKPEQIGHVPAVLYHWRAIEGSTAQGVGQKDYAHHAGRRALHEHLFRCGVAAEVMEIDGLLGAFRVRYALPAALPLISIIIPTRDRIDLLRRCVDSILQRTTYPHYEIIVVDNRSVEPESIAYLSDIAGHAKIRVRQHDQPFNYSRINNDAVRDCRGELICLLNNDVEVITPDWLEELASHAMRPHVGAVGAMLYYPDDTIQHAGVMTGVHGVAAHPYCGMPRGFPGQMARARLVQNMSAVTAACLMVRREVYRQVDGLDTALQVAFNDIDFCLRLRQLGYANVWTPFAELYHHESASRGHEDTAEKRARFMREVEFMKARWGSQLNDDPAYNPNLTLAGEPFALAFPPRDGWRTAGPSTRSRYAAADAPLGALMAPLPYRGADVVRPLLCIGHSHLACVARAAAISATPLRALNFWEIPGAIEHEGGAPHFAAMVEQPLRQHSGPVFSMIGGAAHVVLGALVHPRRFDFVLPGESSLPLDPAAELIPSLAVRRILESLMADYLALMSLVRLLCRGPMFHIEPPPPCADAQRMYADVPWPMFPDRCREISPAALRYKLWRLHSQILADWCAAAAVDMVPVPPAAVDGNGFMREQYYGDGAHANPAYGELVLEQMRQLA